MSSRRIFLYVVLIASLAANGVFIYQFINRKRMYISEHTGAIDGNTIVFLGNSITARFPLNNLMPGHKLANRGVPGDNTRDILARVDAIVNNKPKAIFLMAGINDLLREFPFDTAVANYRKIIEHIGDIPLYIQSVLPVGGDKAALNPVINRFNDTLEAICRQKQLPYLPINELFVMGDVLDSAYTDDGLHLVPGAYPLWAERLKPILAQIDAR